MTSSRLSILFIFACVLASTVLAKPKTVIYWGQESDGPEQPLRNYCASGNYDIIVMGFAYEFPTTAGSAYPALNFASHCETAYDDANPLLLICPTIGADITYCQSLGVQISLSFGGGVGLYGFSSDAEAVTFATLVWNMFMEGSHPIRPFGTAIIDGVDLDIEGGGTVGYVAFINTLRSYFATSNRQYYISSAPQCVYPDGRLGPSGASTALGGAWFDNVFVQFYNNYCGLEFEPYLSVPQFNFNVWANWARTGSVNPNVKVFIGAPASSRAAGAGYVNASQLQAYAAGAMASYSDVYGGIMLWDTSNSDNNNNFGAVVSAFVKAQSGSAPAPATAPTAPVTSTTGVKSSPPVVPATTAAVMASTPVAPATTAVKASVPAAPSTTGIKASIQSTTGRARPAPTPSTTKDAAQPAKPTQPATPVASPTPSMPSTPSTPSTPSSTPSSSCTPGYMRCITSETYSMCDRGTWAAPQSCQPSLTCSPSGNYVYCV